MILLNNRNSEFYDILYGKNKLIKSTNGIEKNNSEELLTISTLVLHAPLQQAAEEYGQLEKILSACRIQKESYKVEQALRPWSFYRSLEQIKTVLLFGISENSLKLRVQFNENQIIKFDNITFIKTSSIADIMNNQAIKNTLWQNALKPHFIG